MVQIEIYELFKALRNMGYDEYLCVDEVIELMKSLDCSVNDWRVRSGLVQLCKFGYLDKKWDLLNTKKMVFKLKDKYVGGVI